MRVCLLTAQNSKSSKSGPFLENLSLQSQIWDQIQDNDASSLWDRMENRSWIEVVKETIWYLTYAGKKHLIYAPYLTVQKW